MCAGAANLDAISFTSSSSDRRAPANRNSYVRCDKHSDFYGDADNYGNRYRHGHCNIHTGVA